MKASFVRLALATTMMMPFAPAMAADIDLPPIRPSIIALGIIGGVNALDGDYDFGEDPEMSGTNWGLGVRAAYDYYGEGGWAVGIVGDWMWGLGEIADNVDPVESTYLDMNYLATLRARAGWAADNTLLYVTGGLAAAQMEFGGLVGSNPSVDDSDKQWTYGWTIGTGIEYAVTENFAVGLEYLYIQLDDTEHSLYNPVTGQGGDLEMTYNELHTVRLGLSYRFGI
jgi:outer membrane immunogenic protein